MKNDARPLKVAFHGMDSRSIKTMMLFFQGPCKGAAIVVNASNDADADVFDADVPVSKQLLEAFLQKGLLKPVIVLSLNEIEREGILYLKKPFKTGDMQKLIARAKTEAAALLNKTAQLEVIAEPETKIDDFDFFNDELFEYISSTSWDDDPIPESLPQILRKVTAPEPAVLTSNVNVVEVAEEDTKIESTPIIPVVEDGILSESELSQGSVLDMPEQPLEDQREQILKTYKTNLERSKTSKHQTALRLDERNFYEYVGTVDDIDLDDPRQLVNAHYNPHDYFQGYLQSAMNLSRGKGQSFLVKTRWCPVVLFGGSQEVWLDASDSELSTFAGLRLRHKTMTTKLTISPIDPNKMDFGRAMDKFQSMDGFLWKLACWTSKGRYPQEIDYNMPVYLKNWPNFTRLLITPHALRIAALMIKGPRTMANIAETLSIKPQYVFVFISAVSALGYAKQVRRSADTLVKPPDIQKSKGPGLLGRIMSKLRHTKT